MRKVLNYLVMRIFGKELDDGFKQRIISETNRS